MTTQEYQMLVNQTKKEIVEILREMAKSKPYLSKPYLKPPKVARYNSKPFILTQNIEEILKDNPNKK